MDNIKKKNILLIIAVIMIGLLVVGGTFAYLISAATVTNGNYVTNTRCFNIEYVDNTDRITGTLFPSGSAKGGLSGSVIVNTSPTCNVNGRGRLYLNVDTTTSDTLLRDAPLHCEDKDSLEIKKEYKTLNDCEAVSGNKWSSGGTALKYAVFIEDKLYSSGYISSLDKTNGNKIIYDDFSVTSTAKRIDVYVWLDGNLSDESYTDLSFSGSIKLELTQTKSTDTTFAGDTPLRSGYVWNNYQRVEYIQSTGTQYINTNVVPSNYLKTDIVYIDTSASSSNYVYGSRTTQSSTINYALSGSSSNMKIRPIFNGSYYDFAITRVANKKYHSLQQIEYTAGSGYRMHSFLEDLTLGNTYEAYTDYSSAGLSGNLAKIYVFAFNSSNIHKGMKLYSLKFWDNNVLIRDFIPVYRKSDRKPGLYDTVNDVFYTNGNSQGNDFTLGPDV